MSNNKLLFSNYKLIEGLENGTSATTLNRVVQDSLDISNNISYLNNQMQKGIDNDILDKNGNLVNKGRLVDIAQEDTQIMLVQQNTLYMIGTITIATLLITAILLSK
jgi:2-methylaconitate cis-trans-isomerase PrpF